MEVVGGGGAVGEEDLRKGPWTAEEDRALANYIALHGDGRWNALARSAGLRRSGKSCRLRWLNYLRPDIRRGNFTPEEQLLILELHCRWGNRWSKIAQHLPGRTDNEIKNYWRTRVHKHAKQLKCDVNSQRFRDAVRRLWMPHLLEKIQASSAGSGAAGSVAASYGGEASTAAVAVTVPDTYLVEATGAVGPGRDHEAAAVVKAQDNLSSDRSSTDGSASDSPAPSWRSSPPSSLLTDNFITQWSGGGSSSIRSSDYCADEFSCGQMTVDGASGCSETLLNPSGYLAQGPPEFEHTVWGLEDVLTAENWWAADDTWVSQDDIFAVLCPGENDDLYRAELAT